MQIKHISYHSSGRPGLLRKALALVVAAVLGVLVLMFSAILLVVVLIVVAIAGVYLWWKTRAVRRLMREQMQHFPPRDAEAAGDVFRGEVFEGEVIEGVAVRVSEPDLKR